MRVALLFTVFEAALPLIGLALGAPLGRAIGAAADYVAIGVLIAFGLYTLMSGGERERERLSELAKLRGGAAFVLGLSISLDELAIGLSFGLLRLPILPVIGLIAAQAFVAAQLGLRLGTRLSERFREGAERVAGAALVGVGVVLLLEKAFA